MRVIVFFDLPVQTSAQRREYTQFRKQLVKDGFIMMQESVYCKLALNMSVAGAIMENIRQQAPRRLSIPSASYTFRPKRQGLRHEITALSRFHKQPNKAQAYIPHSRRTTDLLI